MPEPLSGHQSSRAYISKEIKTRRYRQLKVEISVLKYISVRTFIYFDSGKPGLGLVLYAGGDGEAKVYTKHKMGPATRGSNYILMVPYIFIFFKFVTIAHKDTHIAQLVLAAS